MSPQPLVERIEAILAEVQKPSRYIGGEVNEIRKPDATVRVALAYPDAYEIGISNQALQILYTLVNERTEAAAERVYCPWPDMADALRREGLPLFTLETWRPVGECDLFGITLQAELTYSNVLELLDLAGIPLRSADRGGDDPIVMAGGPSASNPEPLAPFVDVFFMGEAEEGLLRVVSILEETPERAERLERLAAEPYLYVPARGPRRVERAVYADFGIETQPTASGRAVRQRHLQPRLGRGDARLHPRLPLLPRGHVVPAGARAAGRGRRARRARAAGVHGLRRALAHVARDERLRRHRRRHRRVKQERPSLHLSLPSNRVDTGPVALTAAASSRQASITLAPEAATQRMRDIICKTITDEMIERAIDAAFAAGTPRSSSTS